MSIEAIRERLARNPKPCPGRGCNMCGGTARNALTKASCSGPYIPEPTFTAAEMGEVLEALAWFEHREAAVQRLLNTEVRWRHGNTANLDAIGAIIEAAREVRRFQP